MGKKDEKAEKKNGATQQPEAQPVEQTAPVEMSHDDGAADTSPAITIGETTATEPPQDDPGPEDFDRHSGARLVSDHEADLALLRQVEERIAKRETVIGTRLRAKGAHATIRIAGSEYTARVKPNSGGKLGIAKVGPRVETSIDI